MENKIELTASDLALYFLAECVCIKSRNYIQGHTYLITFPMLSEIDTGHCKVKPILRPLSDITDEEEMEVQNHVDKMGLGYNAVQGAEITRYLLSRHFDLFGWIKAGLAIDKTKL